MARSYEDFQPLSDWAREAGSHIYMVDLPGFKREHLRLQLDNSGILNITGECPEDGNKWRRFRNKLLVPANCNPQDIHARFEDGVLYVIFPQTIASEDYNETSAKEESPTGQKTGDMPDSVNNYNDTPSTSDGDGSGDKRTTAAGANKQTKESTDDPYVDSQMKSKDEKEDRDGGKMVDGSKESAGDGGVVKEIKMHGGGLVLGLNQSRQLIVNVVVAFLVVVTLGIYMTYKFRSPMKAKN